MHSLFQDLVAQYIAPRVGSTYQIMGLLMQIFHQLSLPDQYSNTALKLAPDPELQLFDSISAMLRLHSGRISRSELAQALNYSGHYLNRVVKRHTGLSLQQYGMQFAMQAAAGMLCYTDRKVEEICEYLHFSTRPSFYRQFQDRYGLTPRQYRQACGRAAAPLPPRAAPCPDPQTKRQPAAAGMPENIPPGQGCRSDETRNKIEQKSNSPNIHDYPEPWVRMYDRERMGYVSGPPN